MSREIKFRFVYKSKKNEEILFLYFALEQLYTMSPDAIEIGDGFIPLFVLEEDYELIAKDQYIGLTDKNGKEIYEGDIVKRNISLGVVKFYRGAFGFRAHTEYDSRFYPFGFPIGNSGTNLQWEVVGNIYENPELLGQNLNNN